MSDLNPSTSAPPKVSATLGGVVAILQRINNNPKKWSYALATPIADTNPVTIKGAAGAGKKNYLTRVQLSNTGSAAGTVSIKQGTTLIWAGALMPASSRDLSFVGEPLESAANAILTVTVSTTTNFSVIVAAQGFTD